jgi:hypothetical protein
VIPPDANAAFVAAMEDVLETYQKPRDPERPLVCLDETSKQLVAETRKPIPAKPGQTVRYDYEYERNGVANIFMMFAPLEGWRKVKVTDHHAAIDYAQVLKELSDVHFPDAKQIVLVQDNLSTHTMASLYAAFPPEEARRLAKRFEWHSHGAFPVKGQFSVSSTFFLSSDGGAFGCPRRPLSSPQPPEAGPARPALLRTRDDRCWFAPDDAFRRRRR